MSHRIQGGGRLLHRAEQGYLLLGLLFLTAILMLALAIAAPEIGRQIQRDKEAETIQRGEQYKRAIGLYFRKTGSYPSTIKQLLGTDQMRYLRQDYVDPMTGKKDWKLLHLGQVPMVAMGLFGKPLSTGAPPASQAALNGIRGVSLSGSPQGMANPAGGIGGVVTPGGPQGMGGSNGSAGAFSFSDSSGSEGGGGMFGDSSGGPIVGVTVPLKKKSILSYRTKTVYDQWNFVYNPVEEAARNATAGQGGGAGGAAGAGIGTPAGAASPGTAPFGSSSPGSSSDIFGKSSSIGSTNGSATSSSGLGASSSPMNSGGLNGPSGSSMDTDSGLSGDDSQ